MLSELRVVSCGRVVSCTAVGKCVCLSINCVRAHRGFLHTLLSSFWWLAGLQTPPDSAFFTLLQGLLKSVLKQSHGAGNGLDMQGHCAELPELACIHQQSHCAHVPHVKKVGNRVIVRVP